MTNHGDRLREAFESHENQTPDPAAVYAKVVELSTKHKWRRRGASVAGGAALGAGLIAAVVNLPAILPGSPDAGTGSAGSPFVAAAQASPSVTPSVDPEAAYAAYFKAGYDYDDAFKLAKLWNMPTSDIAAIKGEAGRRLLAGETLPFQHVPAPDVTTPPSVIKFFEAGYNYNDAVKLAKLWKLKSPYDAKVAGGKRLLAGQTLPIKPDPKAAEQAQEGARVDAFLNAGYDYEDAVKLAKLWKLKTPYDAKIAGGKRLLAGQTLPIKP
ncbi:hypothetical protein [Actinoplanes awajinensis]|uniref:Uncharacterized protein n=1 Tax=Actinoplanes awajinensis subsp. mycoplanecinus TaxID=135947 RepID=A0A0X3URZ1_9ACTN|nr:hypothetical protein [Actinoplanes awajinensis]KUL35255.1 hypothetical protein ADL15_14635 [Actinoplanes awajinensis subsp. mycoplanecinus]